MKTYAQFVDPYKSNPRLPRITLTQYSLDKVYEFVGRIMDEKAKEQVHVQDPDETHKRFVTGYCCEAALEQFFGVEYMDTTVGPSIDYKESDLIPLGLDVGVKGVRYEHEKFHTINVNIKRPQVIVFLDKEARRAVIMGYATTEVLKDHLDLDLIHNRKLRATGRKKGFYGYNKVIPFYNPEGLRTLAANYSLTS